MTLTGPALDRSVDLSRLLERGLGQTPDAIAVSSLSEVLTWRELDAQSQNLASHYLDLGLRRGDRIVSLLPNRLQVLVHYLACLRTGFVAVPLNYRYLAHDIDHAIGLTEPRLMIAHAERADDVSQCAGVAGLELGGLSVEGGLPGFGLFEPLTERAGVAAPSDRPGPDDPAVVFFTSGSTGQPKGVTHTQRSLGHIVASLRAAYRITDSDTILPVSSFSHMLAQIMSYAALSVGGSAVVAKDISVGAVMPLMRHHQPTVIAMMPYALTEVVYASDDADAAFEKLRMCDCGGDKVATDLQKKFQQVSGVELAEGYGLTEVGIVTHNPPDGPIVHGSVGPAMAGNEFSVRDAKGNDLGVGEEGVLWVRSPSVMAGYFGDPAATAEVINDGWLNTGDLLRFDDQGYFWFCGRKKQIIVHDGSNISPQEVENVLLENDTIEAAAVVGVPDTLHGQNVRAYVVLKPGVEQLPAAEILERARDRIGYKAPEEIFAIERLPENAAGKIDRVALAKMASEDVSPSRSP
ncbi:MAG: class I adenylate-forming enzyme family protein [Pseudomonadota bacterium]